MHDDDKSRANGCWKSVKERLKSLNAPGSALRALEERASLARKLQADAAERGYPSLAGTWADKLQDSERQATVIRRAVERLTRAQRSRSPELT